MSCLSWKCRMIRMCGHGAGPMARNWKPSSPWLRRKAKQGFKGYPVATIAFYGPTETLATKIVVSIVLDEGHDPDPLERWFSEDTDVRYSPAVGEKVVAFLKEHAPQVRDRYRRIIGCPHEEGIDYPEGKSCPQCPYCGRSRPLYPRAHPLTPATVVVFFLGLLCSTGLGFRVHRSAKERRTGVVT